MQLTHIPAHHETKIHQILIELHACAEKRCPAGFLLSCFFVKISAKTTKPRLV